MQGLLRFQRVWALALLASFAAAPTYGIDTVTAFDDTYYCLKNRQKFIALRALKHNPSNNTTNDSDSLNWGSITNVVHDPSLSGGQTYQILGTIPNIAYVPPTDWTGTVTFDFGVVNGLFTVYGTITIYVSDSYTSPYGIKAPSSASPSRRKSFMAPAPAPRTTTATTGRALFRIASCPAAVSRTHTTSMGRTLPPPIRIIPMGRPRSLARRFRPARCRQAVW